MSAGKRSGKGMGEMPMPPSPGSSPLAGSSEPVGRVAEAVASPDNVADLPAPVLGERYIYWCEACHHKTDATFKTDRYGVDGWAVGSAHVDRCPGGKECLDLTAEWMGATLGHEIRPPALKTDPRPFLMSLPESSRHLVSALEATGRSGRSEAVRSWSAWDHAQAEMLYSRLARDARNYLDSRGIDSRGHAFGHTRRHGCEAIMALCYQGEQEVTEAFRWYAKLPPHGRKNDLLRGCPVGWIGAPVPPQAEWVLLVAGFFDAFSARQRGFPAISAVGTNLPDHLIPDLAGKEVVVAFDVGEESAAKKVVEKLQQNGIRAEFVWLERLGLPDKGDLALYFQERGSAARLTRLINQALRGAS